MNKNKIPVTFRKRMILYNLLMIVCIAFTISIYTYSFYKKRRHRQGGRQFG